MKGGMKSSVRNLGMLGLEVSPVAMISFLQVKFLPADVLTHQIFSDFVMSETVGGIQNDAVLDSLPSKDFMLRNLDFAQTPLRQSHFNATKVTYPRSGPASRKITLSSD